MKCPHCLTEIHSDEVHNIIGEDKDGKWGTISQNCPACKRIIIFIGRGPVVLVGNDLRFFKRNYERLAYPKGISRKPAPPEVPKEFAEDYKEACLVIADSPKASAALSRRCLQHILRDVAKVKHADLCSEIKEIVNSGKLPNEIAEALDAIRNIGNLAAHPIKSTSTGELVAVEPGEAEWNLDVLEALFDFYFVRPAELRRKKDALNKKLTAVGKPPMK